MRVRLWIVSQYQISGLFFDFAKKGNKRTVLLSMYQLLDLFIHNIGENMRMRTVDNVVNLSQL